MSPDAVQKCYYICIYSNMCINVLFITIIIIITIIYLINFQLYHIFTSFKPSYMIFLYRIIDMFKLTKRRKL